MRMGEPKVPCSQCGVKILAATAGRTGGLCMSCKNGDGAPESRRRQLWLKRGADPSADIPWYRSPWGPEIVTTCQAVLSGKLDSVEGSRTMAAFSEIVLNAAHGDKWLHKNWSVFFEAPDSGVGHSERVRSAALKLLEEANEAAA